jgi:hypothetical protein
MFHTRVPLFPLGHRRRCADQAAQLGQLVSLRCFWVSESGFLLGCDIQIDRPSARPAIVGCIALMRRAARGTKGQRD